MRTALSSSMSGIERAASFDPARHREDFRRFYLRNCPTTQPRKRVLLEACNDLVGMSLRPSRRMPRKPLTRHGFEAVGGTLYRCRPLDLTFNTRIDTVGEQLANLVAACPRFFSTDLWIDAQRQPLFLASKSVFEPPVLSACL